MRAGGRKGNAIDDDVGCLGDGRDGCRGVLRLGAADAGAERAAGTRTAKEIRSRVESKVRTGTARALHEIGLAGLPGLEGEVDVSEHEVVDREAATLSAAKGIAESFGVE